MINQVNQVVINNSTEQDEILCFPNIPIFYMLSNRYAGIKAVVQWPDFLADNFAISESKRILNSKPKIIVYLDLPELVWNTHEQLFRHGGKSGQREIIKSIEKLVNKDKLYTLETSIQINNEVKLFIWIRNNKMQKRITHA